MARRRYRTFVAQVSFLALLGSSACQVPVPLVDVQVAGETARLREQITFVTSERKPGDESAHTPAIDLAGAANETLSFCLSIRPREGRVWDPRIRATDLTGGGVQLDSGIVSVYRMHPVAVRDWPGWHIRLLPPKLRNPEPLDVLVPLDAPRGGLPRWLEPGETYFFWVDIAIPKGTFAGVYSGAVELLSDGTRIAGFPLQLTVWPFAIPNQVDVAFIGALDHRLLFRHHVRRRGRPFAPAVDDWRHDPDSGTFDALLADTMRLLQRHGVTPVLPDLAPIAKVGPAGDLMLDWRQFDAVVDPLLDGSAFDNRVPVSHWPLPLTPVLADVMEPNTRDLPGSATAAADYVAQCCRHFSRKGWLARAYGSPPGRWVLDARAPERFRRFAEFVRRADSRVAIVSPLFPQDPRPAGWVAFPYDSAEGLVDIWMPPAQFFDADAMAAQRAMGRRTWMAVDRPPFSGSASIQSPAACTRVLTWQSESLGCDLLYLGDVNAWPPAIDAPLPEDCAEADPRVLIYPGTPFGLDEPVASVRLKRLRRSYFDAGYRQILKEHSLGHVVDALARSLSPTAGTGAYRTHLADGKRIGWPLDSDAFDSARKIMATELLDSVAGTTAKQSDSFGRTVLWRRFMSSVRRLRLFADGTRVRFVGSSAAPWMELETTLTVENRTSIPVEGVMRFADAPDEWVVDEASLAVPPVDPNRSRRVTLVARMAELALNAGGHARVPVVFETAAGGVHAITVGVSCVGALPCASPIRIDGDLSDWPPGTTNVASGFQLITALAETAAGTDLREPETRTDAFVLRDAESLYIAVNCEAAGPIETASARRNSVEYDDLVPVGEDLIELLFDPLNAGTRSASDLYHLVIKRSGPSVVEKGIGSDPLLGGREPWPVGVEYQVTEGDGRWTAEIRIPLAAFDSAPTVRTIWGFNVTRFDASKREFSTWSGASGNAYDPLSLGNLHLP